MLSPAVFDTLAALALLAVALAGAWAPRFLYQLGSKDGAAPSRSLAYVLGNMLSAGVMVSAGFVHLLGAAIQDLDPRAVFPLAPFLCGVGFIMTLVADHVAELLSARTGWDVVPCGHGHGPPATESEGGSMQAVTIHEPVLEEEQARLEPVRQRRKDGGDAGKGAAEVPSHTFRVDGRPLPNGNGLLRPHESSGSDPGANDAPEQQRHSESRDTEPLFGAAHASSAAVGIDERRTLNRSVSNSSTSRSLETLAVTLSAKAPAAKQVSFITAALMAGALCFHSILEGMAMGAQESIVDTLHIFIAIFAHKGLAAYALGASLVDSGALPRRFWAVIAVFSLATPAGIALGRVVASFSESGPAAGLSALASGTFLYVAFMEVIPKEMDDLDNGFSKLGMLCLGFGAMSLLAIWA